MTLTNNEKFVITVSLIQDLFFLGCFNCLEEWFSIWHRGITMLPTRCGITRYPEQLRTGSGKGDEYTSRLEEIGVEESLCESLNDAWLRKRGEGIFKIWQLLLWLWLFICLDSETWACCPDDTETCSVWGEDQEVQVHHQRVPKQGA